MGEELPKWVAVGVIMTLIATLYIAGYPAFAESPVPIKKPNTTDELISYYAEKYNVDEVLARNIIYCESRFLEDATNYKAVVGVDVGLFQFNTHYWQSYMAEKGLDIYKTEDNIEAGMWLLSVEGSAPWKWSKPCWSNR